MAYPLLTKSIEVVVNAPHLVVLVKAGVEFPDGEADMLDFDSEPEEELEEGDLFTHAPSVLAASKASIHKT